MTEFERLVRLGGEVIPAGLSERIRVAAWLALLRTQGGDFIGVGALKRPYTDYRSSVFTKARSAEDPSAFGLELGWVYVAESYRERGLANRLVEALVGAAGNQRVYATSRLDNTAMHLALKKYGFGQNGAAYRSDNDDHELLLFVRSG